MEGRHVDFVPYILFSDWATLLRKTDPTHDPGACRIGRTRSSVDGPVGRIRL